MLKSFAVLAVIATGTTLPAVQDIQPVRGATVCVSQFNLEWGEDGFEATLSEQADFALKLKLSGDKTITLEF
jgi:uncharacterized protein YerC